LVNPATPPLFSDAMALRPAAGRPGEFDGNLNEHWTIGPKIHGGVMVALCAKAAREAYRALGGAAVLRSRCRRTFCRLRIRVRCVWSPRCAKGGDGSDWSMSN
jgi:hypothetical protein